MSSNYKSGFTVERLELLEQAIADGALKVKYSDKEVEYRSLQEMLKVRDIMIKKLCLDNSSSHNGLFGGKRLVMKPSKGLE